MLPERLSREIIYQSKWVNLYRDQVRFPDGRIIDQHHVVSFNTGAVGVIVANDNDELLLIESYRYISQSIGWEIPAGGMEEDETIMDAALREVMEETGHKIEDVSKICSYHPSNGSTDQVFNIVKARAVGHSQGFDANEVKSIKWFPKAVVREMIKNNEIADGMSLTGLLLYFFNE